MSADLPLLMALRVQGIAGPERAACALGTDTDDATERLAKLVASDLATERTGRLPGYTISPLGVERLEELLADEGSRTSEPLSDCYDRFMQINPRVLRVASDWQVRRDGGLEAANDHSDAAYDASVVDRLVELHERAARCIERIAGCFSRYAPYRGRLDGCVARLEAGDHAAFTAPLAESYHTVWFELHQDLLLTLGLEREA